MAFTILPPSITSAEAFGIAHVIRQISTSTPGLHEHQFVNAPVATTLTTMYTAATGKRALIKTITVSNSDAVLRAITIHLVPSGGTVGLSNAFMPAVAMPADSMLGWTGLMVLETGYTVQASANGTGLSLYVGGAERQS